MLTYNLFKTQSMLLSATRRKGHSMLTYTLFKAQSMLLSATRKEDADLLSVQNPVHALVNNKEKRPPNADLQAI